VFRWLLLLMVPVVVTGCVWVEADLSGETSPRGSGIDVRKGNLEMEKTPDLPVYHCKKVAREVQVTGKLDDPLWNDAAIAKLVRADNGGEARYLTEARLRYSDTTLYIGFHCVDEYVWGTRTEHDSDVWTEECVEAFICPAGSPHQYYEINVSPKNVVFDACILNPRIGPGMRTPFIGLSQYTATGLITAVYVEGTLGAPGRSRFWNAEYAIPFDQLIGAPHVPPEPGDEWRLNLYRIDSPEPGKQEFYAWSPPKIIDFHTPWRFGILRFG